MTHSLSLPLNQSSRQHPLLKLYGAPLTRSSLVQWYLEEIQVPYEFVALQYSNGSFLNPPTDFLEVNPFGKTPAIVNEEFNLWESGAILLYLAQKYERLPASLEAQAVIIQWLFFANATLGAFVTVSPAVFEAENRAGSMPRFLEPINQILIQHPFIAGHEFTVADVALGFYLILMQVVLQIDLNPYPAIANYVQSLQARPAFAKTLGAQMKAL